MIDLKKNYQIMGIVNTTPDSFSDGGSYTTVDVAYQHGSLHLLEAGADILDIGGNPHVLATKKFLHKLRQTEYYR